MNFNIKKYLAGYVIAVAMLSACAAEININGSFEEQDGAVPAQWQINGAYRGGAMVPITTAGSSFAGQTALEIKTPNGSQFAMMSKHKQPVKAGEVYRLSIAAKGKGAFNIGFYCYTENNEWVGRNLLSDSIAVSSDTYKESVYEVTIPDFAHETRGKLAIIVPVFTVLKDSEITMDAMVFSKVDTAAPTMDNANSNPSSGRVDIQIVQAELQSNTNMNGADSAVQLVLPKVVYAVPGHEMNIYLENIVRVKNIQNYSWVVECTKGRLDELRWRFVPKAEDVGTFSLKITIFDESDKKIAEGATTVVVSPVENAKDKSLTMLIVGDSLTDAAVYPKALLNLMRNDGAAHFRLVGSHAGSGTPVTADFGVEGYGGWRWRTFCEQWSDGQNYRARSKFIAENKSFDIPGYFERYCGGETPEVITIFLGINDIAGATEASLEPLMKESIYYSEQLIATFKQAAPESLIGVALIPPPFASQDAFGRNYGTAVQYYQYRKNQHALLTAMMRRYADDPRVSLIPVYVNLDCRNGYPVESEAAFAGSTDQVVRGCNAVHPSDAGYRQIAESFYAWLKAHTK